MEPARRSDILLFIVAMAVTLLSVAAINLLSSTIQPIMLPTILTTVVVFSIFVSGGVAGLASAAIAVFYAAYFFSAEQPGQFDISLLWQLRPLWFSLLTILVLVTTLQQRTRTKIISSRRKIEEEVDRRIQYYESTIRASEQRLRALLEHSFDAVAIADEKAVFLYASPSVEKVLGYKPEEYVGHNGFEFIHPDDIPYAQQQLGKILAKDGTTVRTQVRNRKKDGNWVWVDVQAINLLNNPYIRGLVINFRDVTEQRQADTKILASEERFRTLFDLAPDVIFGIDAQTGAFTSLSPAFETITGFKRNDWLGKPFLELIQPEDRKKATREFQLRVQGKISDPYELHIRSAAGNPLVAEIRSRPQIQEGKVIGSIGIARDITDRKSAEESLRSRTVELALEKLAVEEEKAKIDTIVAAIGDAVFAVDENGKIILMNAAAQKISGFKSDEAVGKYYSRVFQLTTEQTPRAAYPDFVKEVIQTGGPRSLASHSLLIRRDGSELPISDMAAPFRDEQGHILGAVVVLRDSTKERALEKTKDEFISVASHQLRTPLGSMRWTMELLLQNNNLEAELRKSIQQMYENNQRMITLVNDLLNVSRIDQGRVPDKSQLIHPEQIILACFQELQQLAQKKEVTINFSAPEKVPEIWFDPDRFHEIMENTISNAIKYNRPGGRVDVTLAQQGDNLHLTIADTGIGIPESEQSRVFQKFFRATNAVQSETEGSGLGLFVVKSYIEKWGGTIWFESQPNVGTKFHVDLPLRSRETEERK